jgi:hypothetical protein
MLEVCSLSLFLRCWVQRLTAADSFISKLDMLVNSSPTAILARRYNYNLTHFLLVLFCVILSINE